MSFLFVAAQKSLYTLQQTQLEFEQVLICNQVNWCKNQMNNLSQYYSELNRGAAADQMQSVDEDPYYIELEQMDEQLASRKESLDTQIQALKAQINSYGTMIKNGIESSCKLDLIGS